MNAGLLFDLAVTAPDWPAAAGLGLYVSFNLYYKNISGQGHFKRGGPPKACR